MSAHAYPGHMGLGPQHSTTASTNTTVDFTSTPWLRAVAECELEKPGVFTVLGAMDRQACRLSGAGKISLKEMYIKHIVYYTIRCILMDLCMLYISFFLESYRHWAVT